MLGYNGWLAEDLGFTGMPKPILDVIEYKPAFGGSQHRGDDAMRGKKHPFV